MILRNLAVRDFKGIGQARFDGLSDRLNLFRGPNEAGKSTLVDALHFGLFESSSGVAAHKRALESWGGQAAPEVVLDLVDDDGNPWRITKRFLHTPSTELAGRNTVYRGKDAERRLRAMLGTQPGNRHGVSPTDLGIWPLLWVRQGEAGAAIKDVMTSRARDTLHATLSARTGVLAAGAATRAVRDHLAAVVDAHRSANGRPRGPLADAEQAVVDATLRRDDAWDALEAARRDRDAVRDLTAQRSDLEARVAAQSARAAAADAARRTVDGHAGTVEDAVALRDAAQRALTDARDRQRARERAAQREARTRDAEAEAVQVLADADDRLARAEDAAIAARQAVAEAADTVSEARAEVERAQIAAEHAVRAARADGLQARLDEARSLAAQLRTLEEEARRLPADRELAALAATADRVQAALAARVPVHFTLTAPDGTVHTGRVRAGSEDRIGDWVLAVAEPEDDDDPVVAARADLHKGLRALGCADLDAAQALRARRHDLDAERTRLGARLHTLAPDGEVLLDQALTQLRAGLAAPTADAMDPADAEAARVIAQAALEDAQRQRATASAHLGGARADVARARTSLASARTGQTEAAGTLAAMPSSEALDRAVADATEALRIAQDRVQAAEGAAREDAAVIEQAAQEQEAHSRLAARRDEVARTLATRHEALAQARAQGLYTRWHQAQQALDAAIAARDALLAQVDAARRALVAVDTAWSARQSELAGPVRQLVLRDLPALFPGSEPALDEDGDLVGLRTGDVVETFPTLSSGSREQLGVLLRVALARVLGGGRRLPVLLDDALVHSDAARRARVVDLLRRASDDVQILVFTSHDDDFDRLAADRVFEVRGRPARGA